MDLDTAELEAIALANCANERLHDIGNIQPFGCLLALTTDYGEFAFASENTTEYFGREARDVLDMAPADLLDRDTIESIRKIAERSTASTQREMAVEIETLLGPTTVAAHVRNDAIIVEFISGGDAPIDRAEALSRLRWLTSKVDSLGDLSELLESAVEYLRSISGYDRVMAYRFRPDESGEVVAEAREDRGDSFLGLRFPKHDIPTQARQLYVKTPIRIICDVQNTSVPLLSKNPEQVLDLSLAVLRGTIPVHLQFLQNMGVNASLSLPIVVNNKLWGLFAFHHHAPRYVGEGLDHVLELAGRYVTLLIEAALERQASQSQYQAIPLANSMVIATGESSVTATALRPILLEMSQIIASVGVAYISDSTIATHGRCPDETVLREISGSLDPIADGIAGTDALGETFNPNELGGTAGALSIDFGTTDEASLVFFREPAIETVTWAGSPHKTLDTSGPETRLTPRASFAAFEEIMEGRSDSWEHADIAAASGLQRAIRTSIPVLSADRDALVTNLELVVQELNHRVRNTLALVQSIVRQSLPDGDIEAESFQSLEDRIFSLATAHNILSASSARSLNLRDALRQESAPHSPERVTVTGPLVAVSSEAASVFVLVLHELFSNAAKHGALSSPTGTLDIRWEMLSNGLHLDWTESGGPPVLPPSTLGFGYNLIANALQYEFDGTTEMQFRPEGFFMRLHLPMRALATTAPYESVRAQLTRPQTPNAVTVLDGNVLILEDDFLIAMQTNDEVKRLGAAKVFPARKNDAAFGFLENETINFAVLDVNLGQERSSPVAQRLRERGIPFVFVTGHDSGEQSVAEFSEVPILRKPVTQDSLREAIESVQQL